MADFLQNPPPPNLPLGTDQYDRRYQDQYSNVLRLYFNRLSNVLTALFDRKGGRHLSFPYGAFHQDGVTALSSGITNGSTTPVPVTSTDGFPSAGYFLIDSEIIQYTAKTATTFAGTITRGVLGTTASAHNAGDAVSEVQGTGSPTAISTVLFNNTDYSNGVYASADFSKIYFSDSGVYNIAVSLQLLNFTTSDDNVTLWFNQNGENIPASASIQEVNAKHGSSPGASILALNVFIDIRIGDYIQLKWTTDTGNTVVATYPPGTSPAHPSSPAVILTAQFVSALTA